MVNSNSHKISLKLSTVFKRVKVLKSRSFQTTLLDSRLRKFLVQRHEKEGRQSHISFGMIRMWVMWPELVWDEAGVLGRAPIIKDMICQDKKCLKKRFYWCSLYTIYNSPIKSVQLNSFWYITLLIFFKLGSMYNA